MPITTPPAMEQHSHESAAKPVAYAKIAGIVHTGQRLIRFSPNSLSLTAEDQIRLVLNGLEKTEKSLVLSFYLASHDSEPILAGNIYTYGEGLKNGIRMEERFFPLTLSLDITEAVLQMIDSKQLEVYLQIQTPNENILKDETLSLESVEINKVSN